VCPRLTYTASLRSFNEVLRQPSMSRPRARRAAAFAALIVGAAVLCAAPGAHAHRALLDVKRKLVVNGEAVTNVKQAGADDSARCARRAGGVWGGSTTARPSAGPRGYGAARFDAARPCMRRRAAALVAAEGEAPPCGRAPSPGPAALPRRLSHRAPAGPPRRPSPPPPPSTDASTPTPLDPPPLLPCPSFLVQLPTRQGPAGRQWRGPRLQAREQARARGRPSGPRAAARRALLSPSGGILCPCAPRLFTL
jgi:hypothetical protein